jgi:hypothetical protein
METMESFWIVARGQEQKAGGRLALITMTMTRLWP